VGFVCDIKGRKSNEIIRQGLEVLRRLSHRGATGADPKTGDGAGILIQIPHRFFTKVCAEIGINLPYEGDYGIGLVFLPADKKERQYCKKVFAKFIREEGQILLGWRNVPVDDSDIGNTARETQPVIEQVFIAKNKKVKDQLIFERKLYVIRKLIENSIRLSTLKQLMPQQLDKFFLDLRDETLESALCLVHSRYSTNTFPTWDLSQPFRFLAHNGELNSLRGNINWMRAREGLLRSDLFGKDLKNIFPIIVPGGSDSATIDNVFELLVLAGRSLAEVMMMLIPCAWQQDNFVDEKLKAFYKYQACLMEPWDGPAAIVFSDGTSVGASLDRNGLRPCRYIITKRNTVVMASEVGVLDIDPSDIQTCGRLEPGKIFFIDTKLGRIVSDHKIKELVSKMQPYADWLKKNTVELDSLKDIRKKEQGSTSENIITVLKAFGYSREDLNSIIKPMIANAQEPIGSMGCDTPCAVLSQRPQLLYTYFKQLFAQVTNPAIDPIREELVMSLETYLGPEKNILEDSPKHCHKLLIKRPILTNEELGILKRITLKPRLFLYYFPPQSVAGPLKAEIFRERMPSEKN
jgi:glutamate synthase domain-containing protein 1